MDKTISSNQLKDKYCEMLFSDHHQAMRVITDAGGRYLMQPRGVPLGFNGWNIEIYYDYGLKYVNPDFSEEWVKVLPANKYSSNPTCREDYVKYHYPNFLIDKHYNEWPTFDRNNPDHMKHLHELQKIENGTERSWAAGEIYGCYWFSLTDLKFVRDKLRFKPLTEKLVRYLDDILCSCHKLSLAKSEGGIVFRHENHYFHVRIANHMSKGDGIFIKIQASSYFTADGQLSRRSSPESHIKTIEEVLTNPLGWYLPPCHHIYALKNFDYTRMEGARVQRRLEELRKGIYLKEDVCTT